MAVQFLETKFHAPPIRPEYVGRPRLIDRLNDGQHRKVTLVSAPAGFGKTSIVGEWMAGIERQSCWLSLDRRDNDPVRFLSYLIGALRTAHPELGNVALELIESSQASSPEAALTSLINEIVSESINLCLMLDDYHVIESPEIDEMLDFFIEHLPQQIHLVISTREDPALAFARLRASGQLNEMRAADLRFVAEEIDQFLNEGMKLDLSVEDVKSLEQRTEGWVASLQLAALSIQKQGDVAGFIKSFTGSHRLVLDYLVEEVLGNQSDEIQDFLIQTSILDRMCASLCEGLTERRNGQKTLELLDSSNLFIVPLDENRRWYRYHHLFAELLRERLRETQPERESVLHSRAGEWYSQNGFGFEAIEHALQAGDVECAAGWIEAYLGENFEKVTQATREHWLQAIPAEYLGTRPYMALLQGWSLVVAGRLEQAERCLEAVESAPPPTATKDTESRLQWTQGLTMAGAFRSFIESYRGNFDRSIQYAKQALVHHAELGDLQELASRQDDVLRPRTFAFIVLAWAHEYADSRAEAEQAQIDAISAAKAMRDGMLLSFAETVTAESLRRQGKLLEARAICERVFDEPDGDGLTEDPKFCWGLGFYSDLLAEMDETASALEQAKLASDRASRSDDGFYIARANAYIARTFFSCGELERAKEATQAVERLANRRTIPLTEVAVASAWKVRLWLAEGKLEAAAQWAVEHDYHPDEDPSRVHEAEYFTLARVLIAQDRTDAAIQLLEWARKPADSDNRLAAQIEVLSLEALAHHSAGDAARALDLLNRALSLAEPAGFFRIFLDEGPAMASLLYEASTHDGSSPYIRRLLAEFPVMDAAATTSQTADSAHPDLVEPLSEREVDVLRLMAEGLSNEQVGEKLFISMHTVKVHARNIYAKLDTHNRTEAVARARYFGILTD